MVNYECILFCITRHIPLFFAANTTARTPYRILKKNRTEQVLYLYVKSFYGKINEFYIGLTWAHIIFVLTTNCNSWYHTIRSSKAPLLLPTGAWKALKRIGWNYLTSILLVLSPYPMLNHFPNPFIQTICPTPKSNETLPQILTQTLSEKMVSTDPLKCLSWRVGCPGGYGKW